MSLETKLDLRDQTVKKLQNIIRYNIDSYDGFKAAAEAVDDGDLKRLFVALAQERSEMAGTLQEYVEYNGHEAEDDGSTAATIHRMWLKVRGMFSGGDNYALLAEAERGEDHIKEAYEDVLKETAGSAMNDVLQHQYALVKTRHDQVRDLRDAYKS